MFKEKLDILLVKHFCNGFIKKQSIVNNNFCTSSDVALFESEELKTWVMNAVIESLNC